MHYPLHITVLCTALWILRNDANAAKNGFSAEVLTSFAKNVASVLSTTLLGEYQDQSSNQSSASLPKKSQDSQSLLNIEIIGNQSSESSNSSLSRRLRYAGSANEGKERGFQGVYITPESPRHPKYYNPAPYKPNEYFVNRDARVFGKDIDAVASKNINLENRDNSIDAHIDAASLYYSDRYQQSSGPRYTANRVHSALDLNSYGGPVTQPRYHQLNQGIGGPVQPGAGIEGNQGDPVNGQAARIARGPYNLNYHGPHHAPFYRPGFYPGRPNEGNDQPSIANNGQENIPSRLVDDQNQGQSTLGGYDYNPHFHYRPPYHGGFYPGFPEFPYPQNGSFNPGNVEQGGNYSGGPPFGPPFFPDYRYNPYNPYPQFPPNFYGQRRPAEPQNPPENSANLEEMGGGQSNGNGTANGPPYGYPSYGPIYGDFHFPGYPLGGFYGLPYHKFGHGFHNHLLPYFKPGPYINYHAGPYPYFPSGPWYPHFGGYHPFYNNRGPMMMTEKPEQAEKTANEDSTANSEAEMISESRVDGVRYQKLHSWPFTKEVNKAKSDQAMK